MNTVTLKNVLLFYNAQYTFFNICIPLNNVTVNTDRSMPARLVFWRPTGSSVEVEKYLHA